MNTDTIIQMDVTTLKISDNVVYMIIVGNFPLTCRIIYHFIEIRIQYKEITMKLALLMYTSNIYFHCYML